jgi:hypothetical protein
MADQLTPDTPQVYYRADSTDGWPVTVTLDSKLPTEHLDNPSQHGTTCKILAMPLAGFQPGQEIVATTPNTPGDIINAFLSLDMPALYTAAITRQGAETIRAKLVPGLPYTFEAQGFSGPFSVQVWVEPDGI